MQSVVGVLELQGSKVTDFGHTQEISIFRFFLMSLFLS